MYWIIIKQQFMENNSWNYVVRSLDSRALITGTSPRISAFQFCSKSTFSCTVWCILNARISAYDSFSCALKSRKLELVVIEFQRSPPPLRMEWIEENRRRGDRTVHLWWNSWRIQLRNVYSNKPSSHWHLFNGHLPCPKCFIRLNYLLSDITFTNWLINE